jgi:hypothetical protein
VPQVLYKGFLGKQLRCSRREKLEWDIDYLYFSVREPFPSRTSKADIVFGKVTKIVL